MGDYLKNPFEIVIKIKNVVGRTIFINKTRVSNRKRLKKTLKKVMQKLNIDREIINEEIREQREIERWFKDK